MLDELARNEPAQVHAIALEEQKDVSATRTVREDLESKRKSQQQYTVTT